ncbi:membrane protein [Beggiatoa sp. PS]|nr:membrane protein [Beggiatoa sp. PS]
MPMTFLEEFEADYQTGVDRVRWQIQLSATQPIQLLPMQVGENYPNPIFAVYGLAHGVLPDRIADQLQTFLCSGKVALMARVLPRLLMQKWQFERLDIAAYQLRQPMDSQNDRYRQVPDARLECASNKKLELDLRAMTQMEAAAKQILARVDAGTKTLEINRYNLERHLHRSEQIWQYLDDTPEAQKYEWTLVWQNDTEMPLLDGFDLDIRKLKNHTTYLQDALTYLDGIRTRWQLHLEGRRLQYESNIQFQLLVLTFIAAFAGVVALIIQKPEYVAFVLEILTDNPESITQIGHVLLIGIVFLSLIIFVLKFFYLCLKWLWKKFRCLFRRLRDLF